MRRVYDVNDRSMQNYAKSRVFKIMHINKDDDIKQIYVFCGSKCPDDVRFQNAESLSVEEYIAAIETTGLFSEQEMSKIRPAIDISKRRNLLVFVKERINLDDTINTVKRKVLRSIYQTNIDFESLSIFNMYLFGCKIKQMDTQTAYNVMTRDNRDPISLEVFKNFISNIYDTNDDLTFETFKIKSTYSYEDVRALRLEERENLVVNVALGHSFKHHDNKDNENIPPYVFSVNPFIGACHVPDVTGENFKNDDNVMLMDYGLFSDNANTLYLCTSEDVDTYYDDDDLGKTVKNAMQTYFPFLTQLEQSLDMERGSESLPVVNRRIALDDIEDQLFTTKIKNVNLFYDIYDRSDADVSVSNPEGRSELFSYLSKGISTISAIFSPVKLSRHIPLETIFKFLCSSDKFPFIRLKHEGVNRDNVFKLHAPQINRYGNRVPVLSKSKFNTINNDLCCKTLKTGVACVSLYMNGNKEYGCEYMLVEFNSRCEIAITVQMRDADVCDVSKMDTIISKSVNPIISKLNILFGRNGFLLPLFETIYDTDRVRIMDMRYNFRVSHEKSVDMNRIIANCGNLIFKQTNDKRLDGGVTYEFARVSNYENRGSKKNGLQITFIDGINTMDRKSREIYTIIRVEKINNIHFLSTVPVYIDALLRIFHSEIDGDKCFNQTRQKQPELKPTEDLETVSAAAAASAAAGPFLPDTALAEAAAADSQLNPPAELNLGMFYEDEDEDEADQYGGRRSRSRSRSRSKTTDTQSRGGAAAVNTKAAIDKNDHKKFFLKKLQTADPELFTATGKLTGTLTYAQGCVNRSKGDDRNKPIALTDEEMTAYEKSSGILKNGNASKKSFLRYSEKDPKTNELIVHAIRFGSSEDKMKWYICPRFWDRNETELQNTKPESHYLTLKQSKKLPAHVHDFAEAVNDEEYTPLFPGLIKKSFMPCCFGSSLFSLRASGDEEKNGIPKWKDAILETGIIPNLIELRDIIEREQKTQSLKSKPVVPVTNILKSESKLDATNLGYLPIQIQKFMNTGVGICDDATLKTSGCILRHGVERSQLQSFIGAIAVIHSNPPLSIKDMRDLIASTVTLDSLVSYNNGSLITQFYDKNDVLNNSAIAAGLQQVSHEVRNSDIFKQLNLSAEQEQDSKAREGKYALLYKICKAHTKFTTALKSDQTVVDHELLWDVVTAPNSKLFATAGKSGKGANMIIFDLPENDETHAVNILCPPNRHVDNFFDHRKSTFILIRRLSKEGYSFYEAICLYGHKSNSKTYQFMFNIHATNQHHPTMFDKLKRAIRTVSNMQTVHCPPVISRLHGIMGAKKGYKPNYHAKHIERVLKNHGFNIISQILNYDNRVVGLFATVTVRAKQREMAGFIPTESSNIIMDDDGTKTKYEIKYTDDTENAWLSLDETKAFLLYVNELTGLPCVPLVDVTDDSIDSPMIIGILTETNQFVHVFPEARNVLPDSRFVDTSTPIAMAHAIGVKDDHFMVDKALLLDREYDTPKRLGAVKGIEMETNFLNAFRMTARNLFQKKENAAIYKKITGIMYDDAKEYKKKLKGVKRLLYSLMNEHVIFEDYDISALSDISSCLDDASCNGNGNGSSGDDDGDDVNRQHNHPKLAFCAYNEGSGKNKCALRIPLTRRLLHASIGATSQKWLEPIFYSRLADELVRYERMREFIMGTKLSKHNLAIKVPRTLCEDEIILTQSMVGRDAAYFAKEENVLDYSDDNVKRVEMPNTSVFNLRRKKAPRKVAGITKSTIPDHVIDVLPGNDPSKFSMDVFYGMPGADADGHITFALMVNILHVLNFLPSDENVNSTKQILYDIYSEFDIASNINKICEMWSHFGQPMQLLAREVMHGRMDFETAINHTAYTLTPFDMWLLAERFGIPIILLGDPKMNVASKRNADFFADFFVNGVVGKSRNARILYSQDAEGDGEKPNNFHVIVCTKPLNEFPVYAIVQDLDPARQSAMRHAVDMGVNITLDVPYDAQPNHFSANFLGIEIREAEEVRAQAAQMPPPAVVPDSDSGLDSDFAPEEMELAPISVAMAPPTKPKVSTPVAAAVAAPAPQPQTPQKPEPPKSQIEIHMASGGKALDKALNKLDELTASVKTPMLHSNVFELKIANEERKEP